MPCLCTLLPSCWDITTHFAPVGSTSNERLFVRPGAQSWWCCSCHLMEGSKGHLPQSPCLCLRGAVHLIGRTDCGCVCPISKTLCSAGSSRVGRYEYSTKFLLQCAMIFGVTVNFMLHYSYFYGIFALPNWWRSALLLYLMVLCFWDLLFHELLSTIPFHILSLFLTVSEMFKSTSRKAQQLGYLQR